MVRPNYRCEPAAAPCKALGHGSRANGNDLTGISCSVHCRHLTQPNGKLVQPFVGIIANMEAQLITRFKDVTADGAIIELVIWKVPEPVPPTVHGYKYRAVYAVDGVRVLGFDNERGKGDHCHIEGIEIPYTFKGVDQLIEDFIAAVAARRAP